MFSVEKYVKNVTFANNSRLIFSAGWDSNTYQRLSNLCGVRGDFNYFEIYLIDFSTPNQMLNI